MTIREQRARRVVAGYAQDQAAKAVLDGRLKRGLRCVHCGKPGVFGGRRIGAHHDDYARPLSVVWLCGDCHAQEHTAMRLRGTDPYRHVRKDILAAAADDKALALFGTWLRKQRTDRGQSQVALAGVLGVPQVTVSRWETGGVPGVVHVRAIAKWAGVKPDVVLQRIETHQARR